MDLFYGLSDLQQGCDRLTSGLVVGLLTFVVLYLLHRVLGTPRVLAAEKVDSPSPSTANLVIPDKQFTPEELLR